MVVVVVVVAAVTLSTKLYRIPCTVTLCSSSRARPRSESRQETSRDIAGGWINIKGKASCCKIHLVELERRRKSEEDCRIRRSETAYATSPTPIRSDNGTGSVPVPNDRLPVSVGFILGLLLIAEA
ncbi:hypothetical protein EAG_06896 [Camponotus floridanus]|uniref:Secreted protein n=1 Tax=Camponotus floridanus TaxID=104421 RepID=E2A1N8_CAMFO|nr:hypothetical protein EAG_06896 [Camponotus floridanus]